MNTANVYETLYNNMKNRFTIEKNNCEYNLGEYMLMRAGKKIDKTSLLPAERNTALANRNAISAVFSYVNDKLTLKAPPVKDKTIRRFPFRTSVAAVLSAVIACTLAISYGSAALRNSSGTLPAAAEVSEIEEFDANEYYDVQK